MGLGYTNHRSNVIYVVGKAIPHVIRSGRQILLSLLTFLYMDRWEKNFWTLEFFLITQWKMDYASYSYAKLSKRSKVFVISGVFGPFCIRYYQSQLFASATSFRVLRLKD